MRDPVRDGAGPPDGDPPDWLPGNEIDAELVSALAADDRQRFARVIRYARWYLPVLPADERGPRYLTRDLAGEVYLLVFTSVNSLAATVGGVVGGCVLTGYDELAAHWPEPVWRLAVNPGTPVDIWVTMEVLAAVASGTRTVATLAQLRTPPSPVEPATDAVLDAFLTRLSREPLLVPVTAGTPPGYRVAEHGGGPAVEVFTSPEALRRRHPDGVATTTLTMPELLVDWPGDAYALLVDAGSDTPLVIPGEQVRALLLWDPHPRDPHRTLPAGLTASPRTAEDGYIDSEGGRADRR